jgi:uncharacterized protein (TIGR02594 family)
MKNDRILKIAWWSEKFIKLFFKKKKKMVKTLIEIALQEYGTKEISGSEHNMDIVNYAKESGFEWVNDDETPYCSIFLNWVAMKANLQRSKKANARSWLFTGNKTKTPEIGDVVVFWRNSPESWQGHVGIFINFEGETGINVLGGNQSNEINISTYSKAKVLGYRKLRKV